MSQLVINWDHDKRMMDGGGEKGRGGSKREIDRGVRRYFCAPTASEAWEANGPIPGGDGWI